MSASPPARPAPPAEPVRFDRRDRIFIALCLAVIAAGAAIGRAGFSRAFPEASIDFKVTREEAVRLGEAALKARGFSVAGMRALATFDVDDEAKTFLERTLGLAKASPLFATDVPVWHWSVRWVTPLQKLEYRAAVAPDGRVLAVRRLLPEKDAAPDPGDAAARALAEGAIRQDRGLDAGSLRFITAVVEKRPARTDRTFEWESNTIRFGDAALRYLVEVQGDRVGRTSLFLRVPEKWRRDYETLRAKNEAAGRVAELGFALTFGAILVVFLQRVRRKDVKWRLALTFAAVGAVLQLLASLNELPIRLFAYDTTDAWGSFLATSVLQDAAFAALIGATLFLFVAAGEPLFRETYPGQPALGRILSLRGLRSKRFFRGLLLGYAMTAFFFAYQVVFYVVAERFGAWAPADVPQSSLLATPFPWLGVLVMGFVPATSEEFMSRMFSIPFVRSFAPGWVAVVLPAFIWGFGHSTYPNQPFYIRGLEVGFAGVMIGVVFLREGMLPLLVWHFTVDAVYTALLLVRSSNPYFVISGAAASLVFLVPMAAALVLYVRHGGFAPDGDLSNAAVGSAPDSPRAADDAPLSCAPPRALDPRRLAFAAGLALVVLFLARVVLPRATPWDDVEVRVDRAAAKAAADAFVKAQGDDPAACLSVVTHATALPALEDASDTGAGLIPYDASDLAARWLLQRGGMPLLTRWATQVLPGPVWNVRYMRALDEHGTTAAVDARTGKVVAFRRSFPEAETGASPDDAASRAKAVEALRTFGEDAARWDVVSVSGESRKARRDTRIVFESTTDRAGEAARRLFVSFAGDAPSLYATALKLPEEWVRQREKSTPPKYAALVWNILGLGTLVGLLVVEVVKIARAGAVPWRRALRLAMLLTVPAAVYRAADIPTALSQYRSEIPIGAFAVFSGIRLLVGVLVSYVLALVASALVLAVKPDAPAAFRRNAIDGRRALLASAAAVLLIVAARALARSIGAAFPLEAGVGDFPFPPGIQGLLPAASVLDAVNSRFLILAGGGAFGALLLADVLRKPAVRALFLVFAAGAFAPFDARTWGEIFVPVLAGSIVGAAFLAALAVLLRDDPRAYLFTAAGLGLAGGAADLLGSGVPSWMWNGALAAGLLLALFAWRGLDRPAPPVSA
jgi:membrane protease YdiL (CAAX protease family)